MVVVVVVGVAAVWAKDVVLDGTVVVLVVVVDEVAGAVLVAGTGVVTVWRLPAGVDVEAELVVVAEGTVVAVVVEPDGWPVPS